MSITLNQYVLNIKQKLINVDKIDWALKCVMKLYFRIYFIASMRQFFWTVIILISDCADDGCVSERLEKYFSLEKDYKETNEFSAKSQFCWSYYILRKVIWVVVKHFPYLKRLRFLQSPFQNALYSDILLGDCKLDPVFF